MDRRYYVYILANRPKGALYTGRTSDLIKRVWEHRTGAVDGHTKRYNIGQLVYFAVFEDFEAATLRERQIKRYRRDWKFNLIEQGNPSWKDLWYEIVSDTDPYFRSRTAPARVPGPTGWEQGPAPLLSYRKQLPPTLPQGGARTMSASSHGLSG